MINAKKNKKLCIIIIVKYNKANNKKTHPKQEKKLKSLTIKRISIGLYNTEWLLLSWKTCFPVQCWQCLMSGLVLFPEHLRMEMGENIFK